jgi:hypothetical protein
MDSAYEVIPSAKRLVKSLRDIGYDFPAAVADIIDNSIEAKASRIDIVVGFYGDDSYVRITDNGKGMTDEELKEAMRYGSDREYKEEDLGRFGLGLKTASMSQCQRFSIASKTKSMKEIPVYCWDLAHIEKTNKWEILRPKEKETTELISAPLVEHSGTVVLWEKLDRIISFRQPEGEAAKKKLILMCRELESYLAMVFHKFLAKEVLGKELDIYLNHNKIQPWDPFAHKEPKTSILSPTVIKLIHEGVTGKIVLQPYILPAKDDFSSPEAFERLSGPAKWNQQQGFYIYRANRMIQSGGWCGMRTRDEHTKLSRVELHFSPILDSAFKINVAKMRVQLPIMIREDVERAIKPAVLLARECYDKEKKNGSTISTTYKPQIIAPINLVNSPRKTSLQSSSSTSQIFSFDEIERKVMELSTPMEKGVILNVFSRLRKKIFGGS